MRVGEQLRFAEYAKLCFSASRPSSAPFGGTFPQGKLGALSKSTVLQKNSSAYQREGQSPSPTLRLRTYFFTIHFSLLPQTVPPLRYDEKHKTPQKGRAGHGARVGSCFLYFFRREWYDRNKPRQEVLV